MSTVVGDITIPTSVTADTQVTANFENFLNLNVVASHWSLGAAAVGAIISARAARANHKEQMQLLIEIKAELQKLNRTATAIMDKLDKLPAELGQVLEEELLKNNFTKEYARLENYIGRFETEPNFALDRNDARLLTESFTYITDYEFRTSRLLAVPRISEFVNILTAGRAQDFVRRGVRRAIERVRAFQTEIGVLMVETTDKFIREVIVDPPKNYTGRYNILEIKSNHRSVVQLWDASIEPVFRIKGKLPPAAGPAGSIPGSEALRDGKRIVAAIDVAKKTYRKQMTAHFGAFGCYQEIRDVLTDVLNVDFKSQLRHSKMYMPFGG